MNPHIKQFIACLTPNQRIILTAILTNFANDLENAKQALQEVR